MFHLRLSLLAALAACAVLLSSPSRGLAADNETGDIEGKIVVEGAPLTKGKVSFHLKKGKPITVEIGKEGDYSVKNVPVGEVRITIESKAAPKKYADVKTSLLTFQVKKGKQVLDLDLRK
jgi:hypothetical protein